MNSLAFSVESSDSTFPIIKRDPLWLFTYLQKFESLPGLKNDWKNLWRTAFSLSSADNLRGYFLGGAGRKAYAFS